MQQEALFKQIFQDAHVFDIDFATWDKQITLYVVADDFRPNEQGLLPLFIVQFLEVRHWEFTSKHLEDLRISLEPNQHVQWWIRSFRVFNEDQYLHIAFDDTGPSPQMHIVCKDVNIQQLAI